MPSTAQPPVTHHIACQPPARAATQAASGGPANCPKADHCCIHPTVVDTVLSSGAIRTASENRVPGTRPPTVENSSTPA
jgi:hypothetical protein